MSESQLGKPETLLVMHIPKTAGTSLRSVVEQQYPPGTLATLYPGHGPQIEALVARPCPPPVVIGHFRFGLHARLPGGGRYVTFLRDPVDQVVSHFNYLVGAGNSDNRGVLGPDDGLEEFLTHPWARNLQTQYVCGWSAEEVAADPDRAVGRAIDVLAEHFSWVGLVESFAESVRQLAARMGWRVGHTPQLNPAPDCPRRVRRRTLGASAVREIEDANSCDRQLYEQVIATAGHRRRWAVRTWHERVRTATDHLAGYLRPR